MTCRYFVIHSGDTNSILSTIETLKSSLEDFIEPDSGLLKDLLRLRVLTRKQAATVASKATVYDRNEALIELLTTEDQCIKFLEALQRTDQQHVVNFITQNGGQKHNFTRFYSLKHYSTLSVAFMARKGLLCADLSVRKYSLTLTQTHCCRNLSVECLSVKDRQFGYNSLFCLFARVMCLLY